MTSFFNWVCEKIGELIWGIKCSPTQGGCWFCYHPKGKMLISSEFDCCLHESCLRAAQISDPTNPEVDIFVHEFGLDLL